MTIPSKPALPGVAVSRGHGGAKRRYRWLLGAGTSERLFACTCPAEAMYGPAVQWFVIHALPAHCCPGLHYGAEPLWSARLPF